jgi:transposase
MPSKASSVMEERLRFVARLLDGEAMTDVCRDFGVSRKTGYKIFDRYKEHGLEALSGSPLTASEQSTRDYPAKGGLRLPLGHGLYRRA